MCVCGKSPREHIYAAVRRPRRVEAPSAGAEQVINIAAAGSDQSATLPPLVNWTECEGRRERKREREAEKRTGNVCMSLFSNPTRCITLSFIRSFCGDQTAFIAPADLRPAYATYHCPWPLVRANPGTGKDNAHVHMYQHAQTKLWHGRVMPAWACCPCHPCTCATHTHTHTHTHKQTHAIR